MSRWEGPLPDGVRSLVERALDSIGPDLEVLRERWNRKLPNGELESDFFGWEGNDICCADLVGFALYQSGVFDLLDGHLRAEIGRRMVTKKEKDADGKPIVKNEPAGMHLADFYRPTEHNGAWFEVIHDTQDASTLVDENGRLTEPEKWLPGDVLVYAEVEGGVIQKAKHVNLYVGPYVDETGSDKSLCSIVNGSIGRDGSSAEVGARTLTGLRRYYGKNKDQVWHIRVRAIGALFEGVAGPPLVPEKRPAEPRARRAAELEAATKALQPQSCFPIGSNRAWHGGVHLVHGAGLSDDVLAVAPGTLQAARLTDETSPHGDPSFVLLRHHWDAVARRLVPPEVDSDGKVKAPADTIDLYSLHMHLAPRSTWMLADGTIRQGVGTPPWIARLALVPVPAAGTSVRDGSAIGLRGFTAGSDAPQPCDLPLLVVPRTSGDLSPDACPPAPGPGGLRALPVAKERSNQEAWDGSAVVLPPPKSKLALYNPLTGEVVATKQALKKETLATRERSLELVFDAAGRPVEHEGKLLARVAGYSAGVAVARAHTVGPDESGADLLAWTGTLTVALVTRGEGARRTLGQPQVACKATDGRARVVERATCRGRDLAWLDLQPCVLVTPDERAARESALAYALDVRARLDAGISRIVGAVLSKGSGWTLRADGALVAREERVGSPRGLTLMDVVEVDRRGQLTLDATGGGDTDRRPLVLEAKADVALRTLRVVGRVALVELVLVAAARDNADLVQAAEDENARRKAALDPLLAGGVVDFDATSLTCAQRHVGREPLGRVGRLPALTGVGPRGVHVGVFATRNPIDPAVAGSDGKLEAIPQGTWLVLRSDKTDGLVGKAFLDALQAVLRDASVVDPTAPAATDPAATAPAADPAGWERFATSHAAALARVVAAHPPEFTVDWSTQLPTGTTPAVQARVARGVASLGWPAGKTLPGQEGAIVYHVHPLRWLAWMGTGLDVAIGGTRDQASGVSIVAHLPGGTTRELVRDARSGVLRLRLDDALHGLERKPGVAPEIPVVLELKGLATAQPKLPVLVPVGSVLSQRVAVPGVQLHSDQDQDRHQDRSFSVPVRIGKVDAGKHRLLACGDGVFVRNDYARTRFLVDVAYNRLAPDQVTVELSGSDFALHQVSLLGADTVPGSLERSDTRVAFRVVQQGVVQGAEGARTDPFDGSRGYTVDVHVTARRKVGASTRLTVTVAGGDLSSSKAVPATVETRELSVMVSRKDHAGEDLAQLQLMLSQMVLGDSLPVYRSAGKVEHAAWPTEKNPVVVDALYGTHLARALWRFVGHFAGTKGWNTSLRVTDAKGKSEQTLDATAAHDAAAQQVVTTSLFPIVDQALVDEIVARARVPWIVGHVWVLPGKERKETGHAGLVGRIGWNGRTTMLPVDDEVELRFEHAEVLPGTAEVAARIELPDDSAYRIRHEGADVLARDASWSELASISITLVPTGATSTTADEKSPREETLLVRDRTHGDPGGIIGRFELGGVRDLRETHTSPSRADVRLQSMLAHVPGEKGKPCVAKITGQAAITKSGLAAFQKAQGLDAAAWKALSWKDVVERVQAAAASGTAAEGGAP